MATPTRGEGLAPTVMVQGTASAVGKSLLVTGLCRWYRRAGVRVAPFKAQNLALNSHVTADGHEIGRAQAVQAEAAGVAPHVDMNPVLLKPEAGQRTQLVLRGRVAGTYAAGLYGEREGELRAAIAESLSRLRRDFELVVIEGAGSPAEINLRERDLVNMFVAELADAPVLLVGDIDRGGVFASLLGTLDLLAPHERARVAGLVVNKFRGRRELLDPGLHMLAERAGVPVVGVLPHLGALRIADEDGVALDERRALPVGPDQLLVCVVRYPHLSNFDDVLALEHEPGVVVRFCDAPGEELRAADLVVLPGSKHTRHDLGWLRARGFEPWLAERARQGRPLLGICGGCQMLGRRVRDPRGVEGEPGTETGLGLLPLETVFEPPKVTRQVRARPEPGLLTGGATLGRTCEGYEIHLGRLHVDDDARPALRIDDEREGAASADGAVLGTLVHGLLDDDVLRGMLLAGLWARRGLSLEAPPAAHRPADDYDRLADAIDAHLDRELLLAVARPDR